MQRYLIAIGLLASLSLSGCRAFPYFMQGNKHCELGRYAEAIAAFDEAIRQRPDFAEAYGNCGLVYYDLRRYEEAIAGFDEAVRLQPDDAQAYILRGAAQFGLERHEKAVVDFEAALALARAAGDDGLVADIEEMLEEAVRYP